MTASEQQISSQRKQETTHSLSFSKRDCALMLATVGAYTALGVWSVNTAYQRFGSGFVVESFMKIVNDPIYIYAVADLGAIFTLASIYTYRDARKRGLRSWPWIPSYFIFGTPAFLLYLLHANKHAAAADSESK
jgi:hypothetical protein